MAERKLFNVKLSGEEQETIKERAQGKPISTYMREAALGQLPVACETPEGIPDGLQMVMVSFTTEGGAYDWRKFYDQLCLLIGTKDTLTVKNALKNAGNRPAVTGRSKYFGWMVGMVTNEYPDANGNCDDAIFLTNPKGQDILVRLEEVETLIEGLNPGDVINR